MTRPVMFLRTAQTESRIEELEQKMAMVMEKLGMTPKSDDDEWEAAKPPKPAPKPEPEPEPEPEEPEPPKMSKIAQKVAARRR